MKSSAKVFLAALAAAGFIRTGTAHAQDEGEILARMTWEGRQYAVISFRNKTWNEAQKHLQETLPGFHLATITDPEEQDVINEFRQQVDVPGQLWLGGIQVPFDEPVPETGWVWITGETWAYTNWGAFEPNDGGAGEYHLALEATWWNDEGSAIESVGGYLAEGEDFVFIGGFEKCPCFTTEDAEFIATHKYYRMCWDYHYMVDWYTSDYGIRMDGVLDSKGAFQFAGDVSAYEPIIPVETVECGWDVLDPDAGLDDNSWWGQPASIQKNRIAFDTCRSIIEKVVKKHDLQCETDPDCARRVIVSRPIHTEGRTVTVNGLLVNDPPETCVNRAPIERVEWYWGDGVIDTFLKMPDGYVYPFPNSHTYEESGIIVFMIYAFDAEGGIVGSGGQMILLD